MTFVTLTRTAAALLTGWLYFALAGAETSTPNHTSPGAVHAALARMAGDWEAHAKFWPSSESTAPPMVCVATVSAKMVMGGRFLFQNVRGSCNDQSVEAIGVIGYDNESGMYEAVSFDNLGTSMALHRGEKNNSGDIVLYLSYEDRATGQIITRRTVRRMISELEWEELAYVSRNGDERKVMEIRARKIAEPARPSQ